MCPNVGKVTVQNKQIFPKRIFLVFFFSQILGFFFSWRSNFSILTNLDLCNIKIMKCTIGFT